MRTLPKTDSDYPPLLLVRTDYGDDAGWQRLWAAIDKPWVFDEEDHEEGSLREEILCVEDPEWAGATAAEVLAALTASEGGDGDGDGDGEEAECGWDVVFLADTAGMQGTRPTLLAVSTDPEEIEEPYRIAALGTPHAMHCNLAIANMDFEDFHGEMGV